MFSDHVVDKHAEKQSSLLGYYHEHIHNKFNKYAYCFFFCELLNILICVSQVEFSSKVFQCFIFILRCL